MAAKYEPKRITQEEGEQLIRLTVTGQWQSIKKMPDFIRMIHIARKADNHLKALLNDDDLADEVLSRLCSPSVLTEEQYRLFRENEGNVDFPVPSLCCMDDPGNYWGYVQSTIIHCFIVSYDKSDPEHKKLVVPTAIREAVGVENGYGSRSLDEPADTHSDEKDAPRIADTIAGEAGMEPAREAMISDYLKMLDVLRRHGFGTYAEVLRRTDEVLNGKVDRLALAQEFIEMKIIRPRKEKVPLSPEKQQKKMLSSLNTLIHRARKVFNDVAEKENFGYSYATRNNQKKP